MTDAPERIRAWAGPARGWNYGSFIPEKAGRDLADPGTEYIRKDIADAAVLAEREKTDELASALRYMVNHAGQLERNEGVYWEATEIARAALIRARTDPKEEGK